MIKRRGEATVHRYVIKTRANISQTPLLIYRSTRRQQVLGTTATDFGYFTQQKHARLEAFLSLFYRVSSMPDRFPNRIGTRPPKRDLRHKYEAKLLSRRSPSQLGFFVLDGYAIVLVASADCCILMNAAHV